MEDTLRDSASQGPNPNFWQELEVAMHLLHSKSKRPLEEGWRKSPQSIETLREGISRGKNLALQMGEPSKTRHGYLHALDADLRDSSRRADLEKALNATLPESARCFAVITGSGMGHHYLFFAPEPLSSFTIAKGEEWELALKGTGTYIVAPGSIHPSGGRYEWVSQKRLDPLTLDLLGAAPDVPLGPLRKTDRPRQTESSQPVVREKLESALAWLDPSSLNYEEWRCVGMGLHHEGGGAEWALRLFDEWSKSDLRIEKGYPGFNELRTKWLSFGRGHERPVTGATILAMAKQKGFDPCPGIVVDADDFDDLPPKETKIKYIKNKDGSLRAVLSNAVLTLQKASRLHNFSIRRNEFSGLEEIDGDELTEHHLDFLQIRLEQNGMPNVGKERTFQAVRVEGSNHIYHPVRDYLATLQHDGVQRIEGMLSRYFNVEDSDYTRAVSKCFLIGMVARVMEPGCKMDTALVLQGKQGLRKSTACAILGGKWFGENQPAIIAGNKDADQYPPGHWLIELAEGAPTKKSEQEHLKQFVTRREDELRLPYGRLFTKFPRQSVFVVTTNQKEFLRDDTDGRRWWPVAVQSEIDTEALAQDRDQLFAEALSSYRVGAHWHLSPEMEAEAAIRQENALEEHPWQEIINDFLERDESQELDAGRKDCVRLHDLFDHPLNLPMQQRSRAAQQQVAGILRRLGFEKKSTRHGKVWLRC